MTHVTITKKDIMKGIYIDFEGNVDMAPTLLGAYYIERETRHLKLTQYVHETKFRSTVRRYPKCTFLNLNDTFEQLAELAYREGRYFFAWSSREKDAISMLIKNHDLREYVLSHLIDCKKLAKKWKRRYRPNVEIPYVTGQGRHRLSEYANLINYSIPTRAVGGNTGENLRYVRGQLQNHSNRYLDITNLAKKRWENVLIHNEHDCKSMREVAKTAILDLNECRLPVAA